MLNLTVTEVRDRQRDEREPILVLVGDQHPEMLNTRYLRLLQEAADGPCVSLGVGSMSASPQTSASEIFRLRHSAGVQAYRPRRSAP